MDFNPLLQPVVQYGFLGFSVVLLALVIWLIKRLLGVLDANNKIISENTTSVKNLISVTHDLHKLTRSLLDKLLARPCIAKREEGGGCE